MGDIAVAVQFIISFCSVGLIILVALVCLALPIYFDLPWWYDVLIVQDIIVRFAVANTKKSFIEGSMSEDEAFVQVRSAERISAFLILIGLIGAVMSVVY